METKKRIFFVVSRMHGGGAQKVVLNILNYMAGATAWEVTLVLFRSQPEDAYLKMLSPQVRLVVLGSGARSGWWKLAKILRRDRPDVVFSTLNYINVSVIMALWTARSRALMISREARPISQTAKPTRLLQRLFYRRIDHAWAITPEIAEELVSLSRMRKGKVFLAPNPLNFSKEQQSLRGSLLPHDPVRILYLGRLIELKRVHLLIESLSRMVDESWELTIVGAGDQEERLKRLVAEKGLSARVHFAGYSSEAPRFMSQSDVFCLPSRFEGFPNVVIEALWYGNVCVANDTLGGGVRYIHSLADAVRVLDFSDADQVVPTLTGLIRDKERLTEDKRRSAEQAEQFHVESFFASHLQPLLP